ncbi:nucleoside deaminase [bacterium]|nr:nucleoside deaminase [bacterium]
MRMAIEKTKEGVAQGQSPFGSCIVKNGEVISCEHNVVWKTTDITAHAEVTAIRAACKKIKSIDLSGSVLFSTCEPCPMCFASCHWAKIDKIVFGASITDAQKAGFNELTISCDTMKNLGGSHVKVEKDFLHDECAALFDLWKQRGGKKY